MDVTYDFYMGRYHGGSISFDDWAAYAARAADQLQHYKRVYTVTVPDYEPDAESLAVCAMAEALHNFDLIANGESGAVQSTSIGSVSVGYGGVGTQAVDISPSGQAKELYRCACLYLDIYRGVG